MDEELKRLFENMRQENTVAHAETRRHFEAVAERMEKRMDALSEAVATVDEKLDRKTADLEAQLERGFAETQSMI